MIIEDTGDTKNPITAKTIELTQLLDKTATQYINDLIKKSDANFLSIKDIYQILIYASINFSVHSILDVRDKLEDNSQEFFLKAIEKYFSEALYEISEYKREKDELSKNSV